MNNVDPKVFELLGRALQAFSSFPQPAPAAADGSEDGSAYAPEVGSEDDAEPPASASTSRQPANDTASLPHPPTRSSSRSRGRATQPLKRSASARTIKTPPSPDPSAPPPPIKKRKLTLALAQPIKTPGVTLDESPGAPAPDEEAVASVVGPPDGYPSCDSCISKKRGCTWERNVIDLRLEGNPKPETACLNCKVHHFSCHISTSSLEAFRAEQHRVEDAETGAQAGSKKVKRTLADVFEISRQTHERVGDLVEALHTVNGTFVDFLARTDSAASGPDRKKGKGKAT